MESVGGKRGREKEEGTTRDDVEGPGNNPTLPVHPLASRHVPLVSNCPLRSNATKRNWHVHAPLESSCSIQRCLGCHRWKLSSLLRRQPMLSHTSSLPSVRELLSTYTLHMHPVGRPVVVLTQFFSLQIGQENVPRYMIKEEPNGHADAVQQFCNIHLQQRKKKTKRLCREAKPAWNRCHLFQLEENTTQCNRDETGTETCNHSERVNT